MCVCFLNFSPHTDQFLFSLKSTKIIPVHSLVLMTADQRLSYQFSWSASHFSPSGTTQTSFLTQDYMEDHLENLLLHTGHSWLSLVFQNCWRQSLQALWLHKRTGALKIALHKRQEKSSSDSEATFCQGLKRNV